MASELVDVIAQAIRVADGSHTMGAGELAEHIADLFEWHSIDHRYTEGEFPDACSWCGMAPDDIRHREVYTLGGESITRD